MNIHDPENVSLTVSVIHPTLMSYLLLSDLYTVHSLCCSASPQTLPMLHTAVGPSRPKAHQCHHVNHLYPSLAFSPIWMHATTRRRRVLPTAAVLKTPLSRHGPCRRAEDPVVAFQSRGKLLVYSLASLYLLLLPSLTHPPTHLSARLPAHCLRIEVRSGCEHLHTFSPLHFHQPRRRPEDLTTPSVDFVFHRVSASSEETSNSDNLRRGIEISSFDRATPSAPYDAM